MKYDLQGKCAVVTGGSQGLGLEIAKAYARAGVSVAICGRDTSTLEEAKQAIGQEIQQAGCMVIAERADVAQPDDVKQFVGTVLDAFSGKIDILVNNAGIYGPKGFTEDIPWEEWARTIEINLYGSVLPAREIVPHMKKRGAGKIIQVSGGGATQPMARFTPYAASKAAVVRFADSLAEELKAFKIDVNSIAAGALNTRFLQEVLDAGPDVVGEVFYKRSLEQQKNGGVPFEKPVELILFLSSPQSDGITGKLISALWDNWQQFPEHREELSKSDVYSIRRVVGKDRHMAWGDK